MLRVTIQINNNEPIREISIRRLSPNNPNIGEMCKYTVEDIQLYKDGKEPYICFTECPYGDATVLVAKAFNNIIMVPK